MVTVAPGIKFTDPKEPHFIYDKHKRYRGVHVPKPRLPWTYTPRDKRVGSGIQCGPYSMHWSYVQTPQVLAAWAKKHCGPKRAARQFSTAGAEDGTLAGARRAEGLFDDNWGQDFPLTRAEQQKIQDGEPIDPFFQPPTQGDPTNWIEKQIGKLRRDRPIGKFTTAEPLLPLCPPKRGMVSCSSGNATIGWVAEGRNITPEEAERFTRAYCRQDCFGYGGTAVPPGVHEFKIGVRPRNPAVDKRFSCIRPPEVEEVIGPTIPPLDPRIQPIPAGEVPPPKCCPDIVLGRDDGPFASGWFMVDRCGTRLLVPNPMTCPT